MEKSFEDWDRKKSLIHNKKNSTLYIYEREIWWCSLGINIGDEEDGKGCWYQRPVLIIKKFNKNLVWTVPFTTKSKDNPYYFKFKSKFDKERIVMISHFRAIDTKRFTEKIGKVSEPEFLAIKKAIVGLILPSPF